MIKELGFEINFLNAQKFKKYSDDKIEINDKSFKIPNLLFDHGNINNSNSEIKEALKFNRNLLMENFIMPNRLKFPSSRNILENYYN